MNKEFEIQLQMGRQRLADRKRVLFVQLMVENMRLVMLKIVSFFPMITRNFCIV